MRPAVYVNHAGVVLSCLHLHGHAVSQSTCHTQWRAPGWEAVSSCSSYPPPTYRHRLATNEDAEDGCAGCKLRTSHQCHARLCSCSFVHLSLLRSRHPTHIHMQSASRYCQRHIVYKHKNAYRVAAIVSHLVALNRACEALEAHWMYAKAPGQNKSPHQAGPA